MVGRGREEGSERQRGGVEGRGRGEGQRGGVEGRGRGEGQRGGG